MKLMRYKIWLALALGLAGGFSAAAQSNGVPGPTDYSAFSRFVAERNIFDPNRYPHNTTRTYRPTRTTRATPTFTLVGTMSYDKGVFAFFSGTSSDLQKVIYPSDTNTIAGFTVTNITLAGATLQSADKKRTVQLKIGDSLRLEGNAWLPANGPVELSTAADTAEEAVPATTEDSSSSDSGSTSDSGGDSNDILKKLMQQREQELK